MSKVAPKAKASAMKATKKAAPAKAAPGRVRNRQSMKKAPPAVKAKDGKGVGKGSADGHDSQKKQPLDKASLAALGSMTLDDKLGGYRSGKITTEDLKDHLDANEKMACWKRLRTALGKDTDEQQMWNNLSAGRGDITAKNNLLFGWLRDGKFGKHWVAAKCAIGVEKQDTKVLKWVTWEEFRTKHGIAEAQAMVQAGTVAVRPNPADNRFWQFCEMEELAT
jgi:hypothetical protein